MTKLVYFAWMRERIGFPEEQLEVPAGIETVQELIAFLVKRSEGHAAAFAEPEVIRAAIDHEHVGLESRIGDAREIAFFPPMTGG